MNRDVFMQKGKEILGQKTAEVTTDVVVEKTFDLFVPGWNGNYTNNTLARFKKKIFKLPETKDALKIAQICVIEMNKICTYHGLEKYIGDTTPKFINYLLMEIDKLIKLQLKYKSFLDVEIVGILKIKAVFDELYFNSSNKILVSKLFELKNIFITMDRDDFSFNILTKMIVWTFTHYYNKITFNFILKRKISKIASDVFKHSQQLDLNKNHKLNSNMAIA